MGNEDFVFFSRGETARYSVVDGSGVLESKVVEVHFGMDN